MGEVIESAAGQTILQLSSRGNSILAELLRLSEYVPAVFFHVFDKPDPKTAKKNEPVYIAGGRLDKINPSYQYIIFDFRYFQNSELYETRIENSTEYLELDNNFREEHIEILKRFYQLFESVYRYVADFNKFLEELEEGLFIQQTLDGLLLDADGKQLISEIIYLYGTTLLLMDHKVPGPVRERLLVSYIRYKGTAEITYVNEVCELFKRTDYTDYVPNEKLTPQGAKYPVGYPEKYFSRYPIPQGVVQMVLSRLRTDDIYSQVVHYPLPDHRSVALSTQARAIYILLFFCPDILKKENSIMREIVDKHFADNWVIAYYLGFVADLSLEWGNYPAAKAALNNTLNPNNIKSLRDKYWNKIPAMISGVKQFLTEGVLTEEYVLVHHQKLIAALRECNITIRWLMLHTTDLPYIFNRAGMLSDRGNFLLSDVFKNSKAVREIILQQDLKADLKARFNPDGVLLLLLYTAQLEYVLGEIYKKLLASKDDRWLDCKNQSIKRMNELSEYYSGDKPLTTVERNESLQKWFGQISTKISELDYNDSVAAGRNIQRLIQALEEVEQFQHITSNALVTAYLGDTRKYLAQMLRVVNIREQYLDNLDIVCDLSYGWEIVKGRDYIGLMQERIKRDPSSTVMLRSTFLKLKTIMDWPLLRISQLKSPDLVSVSKFYSQELVKFVRRVLEIVPKSMFVILNKIIELQTNSIKLLPTKLEKVELRDFAQLEERYELAQATYQVSIFTEGILAMQTTLVGVIQVQPKLLLEEGIRKELVYQLSSAMDQILRFSDGTEKDSSEGLSLREFEGKLNLLSLKLNGFRRSFQYIQDYAAIYGLKIWQEEFSRIVNYNVEQECNSFLKIKVFDSISQYQSTTIPIPTFPSSDRESVNFIGRLARSILNHTNPNATLFLEQMSSWYDRDGKELIGIKTFDLLLRSVGVFGVTGVDKLLCFMIVNDMQKFLETIKKVMDKNVMNFLAELQKRLEPTSALPRNTAKLYKEAILATQKLWPLFLQVIPRIGQFQLIRRQISNTLNFTTKLDSAILARSLNVLNSSILSDTYEHYIRPETKPYPGGENNDILYELTKFIEVAGLSDPLNKIYITTSTGSLEGFALLMFLFVISQLPKFHFNKHLQSLLSFPFVPPPPPGTKPKKNKTFPKNSTDATPLIVGILTFMKQFHSFYTQEFLAYLGQYIRGILNLELSDLDEAAATKEARDRQKKQPITEYSDEVLNVLLFLEEFCKFGKFSRKEVEGYVPAYIFDNFKHGQREDPKAKK